MDNNLDENILDNDLDDIHEINIKAVIPKTKSDDQVKLGDNEIFNNLWNETGDI